MTLTAVKIALREARAARGKFLFVILAVAAGVGALTGVRGFSAAFGGVLLKEARSLMAADVSARMFAAPTREQEAVIASLVRRGVEHTRALETLSMVSTAEAVDPVLVTVKGVDPSVFPFYGALTLDQPGTLRDRLQSDSAVVSDDLRARLNLETGDRIRIGGHEFQVAATVIQEPDRISGSFNVGPRVIISHEGLNRAGLMGLGSRATQRHLFRLRPGSPSVDAVRRVLTKAFPEALITDYREVNPNIARGLERATMFLSLVSLIALIVGAIGVGTSMHAHLQQKMESIAIMKSIGGRSNQVIRIYSIQTLLLGLTGGLLGVLIGFAVQKVFPVFLQRYFPAQPDLAFTPATAVQGLIIGLLTTMLFTIPALLGVRRVPPGLIFRRDMAEVKPSWKVRLREARSSILVGVLICISIAGIAAWLAGGFTGRYGKLGVDFAVGLIVSIALLWGVAALLMRLLRAVVRRSVRMPMILRHAVANLYRPGSQATAVLIALGVGVMFTLTVFLIQRSVVSEISRSAPPGMPNVFFLDITATQQEELLELIAAQPGLDGEPELIPTVSFRLSAVDGTALDSMVDREMPRRYRMARAVTTAAKAPEGLRVVEGKWWDTEDGPAQISITQGAARSLRVRPGSTLTWSAFGKTIETKVAAIHRMDSERLRAMVEFVVSPGVLDGLPTVYYAAARMKTAEISSLQRETYKRFPTVTVVNIAEVVSRVQEIVNQIAVVIRFISAFAIFAGAIILSSSIAGTRYRRTREVVIFKTLGATRGRIARMFSAEFLILGTVAGLMGSGLATLFSSLLLSRFFEAQLRVDWVPNVVAIAGTALIAAASGWLASFRILGQSPLEVLRAE
jgi:putative ABC transport system permease protein